MRVDHYATLGVAPDAPPEVIRAAYRALAQKYHPDRATDPRSARETMARLNAAHDVLSDPAKRRAYDRARAPQAPQALQPGPQWNGVTAPVTAEGGGHRFALTFVAGQVIDNALWSDTQVSSRGGGGLTLMGFGYNRRVKVKSEVIPRQRIAVRTRGGLHVFVEQSGSHIPVAVGQDVEVVRAFGHDTRQEADVALVNRSSGRWYWVGWDVDAGKAVCRPVAKFWDFMLYLAVVGGLSWLGWHYVHPWGWFDAGVYLLFGVPALIGAFCFLLWRTPSKISRAMGRAISAAVTPPGTSTNRSLSAR